MKNMIQHRKTRTQKALAQRGKEVVYLHVGTIQTRVSCSSMETLKRVDKLLADLLVSPILPDAIYTNAYLNGEWDGKEHYYNKQYHFFYSGFINSVITALQMYGFEIVIVDDANAIPRIIPPTQKQIDGSWNSEYELYHFQEEAVKQALLKNGVIHIPTGGGKTVVAARLIYEIGQPTVFFVHTKSLLYQTRDALRKILKTNNIGLLGDGVFDIDHPIIVASVQTVVKVLYDDSVIQLVEKNELKSDALFEPRFTVNSRHKALLELIERTRVIIFDECHHLSATTFTLVAKEFKYAPFRFGLSATPFRTDRRDMAIFQLTGEIIFSISLEELINEGFLAKPYITMVRTRIPPPYKSKRYSAKNIIMYLTTPQRNHVIHELVHREIKKHRENRMISKHKILIITNYIKHAESIKEYLLHYWSKDSVALITGNTSAKQRKIYIEAFEQDDNPLQIIVATGVFNEGVDLPTLNTLILANAGKSIVRVYQMIGRALRKSVGKGTVAIYDIHDLKEHYLNRWAIERFQLYQEENAFKQGLDVLLV